MATIKCTVQRSDWYEVYFEYSYTQDQANAKSTVSHALKLKQITNSYDFDTVSAVKAAYKVAGVEFSKTAIINIDDKGNAGYTITLASGTSTIAHDTSTGVGSFTVEVDTSINSGGYGPGTIKLAKQTVSLATIYRASTPTVATSAVMGTTVDISTNRKSTSFTHTLKYDFGTAKGITIATDVGDKYSWKVPDIAYLCNNALSGTATITCITYNGSTKIGEKTCSLTLNVPGATTPVFSVSSIDMGGTIKVSTQGGSQSFKHTLEFSFNSTKKATHTDVGEYLMFDVPLDWAKDIPSDKSGKVSVKCITYNGTKQVGDAVTKEFTATVPMTDATIPTVSLSLTPAGSLPSAFSGLYVQGKTGVNVDYTATSTYSTIASYEMSVDGRKYSGDPATSKVFTKPGDVAVKCTVTDSRGFPTYVTNNVTVLPYSKPTIEKADGESYIICERSESDKKPSDTGIYLHIKCKKKCAPVGGKNSCTLQWQYKMVGGSWSDKVTLLSASSSTDTYDEALAEIVTQTNKSYTVRLIVTDTIGSEETYEFIIPTADVTMHLQAGGYGVAFGKYSEKTKAVEISDDWDLVMKSNVVADFVIAQGTSEGWNYRKWRSGVVEFWGTFESVAVTKAAHIPINDIFYAGYASMLCPTMLQNVDVVNYSTHWTNGYDWCGKSVVSNGKINFYIVSITDAPDTVQINAHIIGRWK